MREAVDMGKVTRSIMNYEALEGLQDPAHIVSDAELPEVLTDLQHAVYKRGIKPEKCVYWMHPNVLKELKDHSEMMVYESDSFKGRPIRTDAGMPEDVVLFMAPDAVGLGGKVYNPLVIAYAELQDNE